MVNHQISVVKSASLHQTSGKEAKVMGVPSVISESSCKPVLLFGIQLRGQSDNAEQLYSSSCNKEILELGQSVLKIICEA